MINRAILVGRLTRDPELKHTSNDIPLATFTLAVDRPFRNQQGGSDTDFLRCVVWRRQAENVSRYLSKGSLVGVEGRIQSRSFEDRDGNRRVMTEIVAESVQFLEPKGTKPPEPKTPGEEPPSQSANTQSSDEGQDSKDDLDNIDIAEDDLPF